MSTYRLSDNFIDAAKKVYSFFDGGLANFDQAVYFLHAMGCNPSQQDLETLLTLKKKTKSDTFAFEECVDMYRLFTGDSSVAPSEDCKPLNPFNRESKSIRDIAILFRAHYDHQGTGFISREQLIKALSEPNGSFKFMDRLTAQEAEAILQELKMEGDKIDYVEFISSLLEVE